MLVCALLPKQGAQQQEFIAKHSLQVHLTDPALR